MFIIFGTRGVTYTRERGSFYCPSCSTRQAFVRKGVRRFFTLFFIPVLPLDLLGEYIECQRCRETFKKEVLSYDPEVDRLKAAAVTLAVFQTAIRRVMVLMMMADRRIEESEVETIQSIFERITEKRLSETEIREEIRKSEEDRIDLITFLGTAMPFLNAPGKEAIVKAALMVAVSDGAIQEEEKVFMGEMADALQLSRAHFNGILAEMSSPAITS